MSDSEYKPSPILTTTDLADINQDHDSEEEVSAPSHIDQLADLMIQLEDYTPTIPDTATVHHLQRAGFETSDPRVVRLISLAAQKFVSDIVVNCMQHCRVRGSLPVKKPGKEKRLTLTMEDLSLALCEYGFNVRKPPYFS